MNNLIDNIKNIHKRLKIISSELDNVGIDILKFQDNNSNTPTEIKNSIDFYKTHKLFEFKQYNYGYRDLKSNVNNNYDESINIDNLINGILNNNEISEISIKDNSILEKKKSDSDTNLLNKNLSLKINNGSKTLELEKIQFDSNNSCKSLNREFTLNEITDDDVHLEALNSSPKKSNSNFEEFNFNSESKTISNENYLNNNEKILEENDIEIDEINVKNNDQIVSNNQLKTSVKSKPKLKQQSLKLNNLSNYSDKDSSRKLSLTYNIIMNERLSDVSDNNKLDTNLGNLNKNSEKKSKLRHNSVNFLDQNNEIYSNRNSVGNVSSISSLSSKKQSKNNSMNISRRNSFKQSMNQGSGTTDVYTKKAMIDIEMDLNDEHLKKQNQLIFELNNQPKGVIMIDSNLDIIQYNKIVSRQLLYDKYELISTNLTTITDYEKCKNDIHVIKDMMVEQMDSSAEKIKSSKIFNDNYSNTLIHLNIDDKNMREIKFQAQPMIQSQVNSKMETIVNLILYLESDVSEENKYIIDPRNIQYLLQSLLIFNIITFLILQVPQDLVFGDEYNLLFNQRLDFIVTLIFSVDIILCFFLAQEETEGHYEQDNCLVILNQLKNSFLLDLVATVPLDYIIDYIAFNTSILKSIKIIKIFKLIKILKISKLLSLKNKKIKNTIGSDLILLAKRASGFLDLMRQNLQILIASHQYTIIQYFLKTTLIEDENSQDWLVEDHFIQDTNNFLIQIQLLNENVKTALGLGAVLIAKPFEIAIQMTWMFIGLSMFGQGIGNISSQLNQMNHGEIEYSDTKSQFLEICDHQNVDTRITALIKNDIDDYYKNQNETNLQQKGKVLTLPVLTQLESQIYNDFINCFDILQKISIPMVRYIKNNSTFQKGKIKLTIGSVVNEIFFITKGKITLQDENMTLYNFQKNGEIFCFGKFINQCSIKQGINFETAMDMMNISHMSHVDLRQSQANSDCKDQIRSRMKKGFVAKKDDTDEPTKLNLKQIDELDVQIMNDHKPVVTEEIEYFVVPFQVMESILQHDFDTFLIFWKQYNLQQMNVSQEDVQESQDSLLKFTNSEMCAFILTEEGEIQDLNQVFLTNCPSSRDIIGRNIMEIIRQEKQSKAELERLEEFDCKEQKVKFDSTKWYLDIKKIEKKKIRSGMDSNTYMMDSTNMFSTLKKCLIEVSIVQFILHEQYKI